MPFHEYSSLSVKDLVICCTAGYNLIVICQNHLVFCIDEYQTFIYDLHFK